MKNIQFIDGADNAAYDVFSSDDGDFRVLFPADGQNIEFIEDVASRIGDAYTEELIARLSLMPIRKSDVVGIHGTVFFGLENKRDYYPNKRESDLDRYGRAWDHR